MDKESGVFEIYKPERLRIVTGEEFRLDVYESMYFKVQTEGGEVTKSRCGYKLYLNNLFGYRLPAPILMIDGTDIPRDHISCWNFNKKTDGDKVILYHDDYGIYIEQKRIEGDHSGESSLSINVKYGGKKKRFFVYRYGENNVTIREYAWHNEESDIDPDEEPIATYGYTYDKKDGHILSYSFNEE